MSLSSAVVFLRQEVGRILGGTNGSAGRRGIVRIEVPVEVGGAVPETAAVDLLAWLRAQPAGTKLYWAGRRDGSAVAAAGVADAWGEEPVCGDGDGSPAYARREGAVYAALRAGLARRLEAAPPGTRYYGGLRFDVATGAGTAWQPFGTYRFVLPRFELRRRDAATMLACNLVLPGDRDRAASVWKEVDALALPGGPLTGRLPKPVAREDRPDARGWQEQVRWALNAFGHTGLEKVVLARRATFRFGVPLDPVLLLKHLEAATPNCFHYLFQPAPGMAFVGATPERLFRRDGRDLWSEAVAGTRPRGETARADEQLRDELFYSEKEQREHGYVRTSIRQTLAPMCEHLEVDEMPSEMPLAHGRHLVTPVRGTLRETVETFDLLERLHPTPAVGGYPKAEALAAIRRLEPFDRGWYAGPIGWVGVEEAEFAVALRCGLVRHESLALFSGAGLVLGSTPEAEWAEIEHKIVDFIRILEGDLRRTK
ncbi:isochorismate synthase [Rhodocaloribacter litoris]|uniref:isochorismate synthase n=1 Tax=Rhodocaloribacter litoris TaxID=2558931 RepID=UPI00141E433E|nr:isochorismate synthase [Rhodocaloribacter litoris]QXD15254.1 isochorismate synthase [Rhodocaloribacter litoris]